ncbi:aminopeptidase N [Rhodobacterales bacterium HKCCE3408]|nr:aminopeptidase N [Rhodobacterales bacterium HKCCE3408]
MKDPQNETAHPVRLADYRPPSYLIDAVRLTFRLDPKATRVTATIAFRPNPEGLADGNLVLDGEGLTLISATINGKPLTALDYLLTESGLTVPAEHLPDGAFTWEAEVEIDPSSNTALEGLYISKGMFCTQCEAEGFRKITFYPDRPDVMAPFTVRIESDLPVMLSNGNPAASGPGWAEWHDPHPKPSYLFALVAGDLAAYSDSFTTASGKTADLNIWVRPGDEDRCAYAMDALKRSMDWDERVYGREYDLDVFNIVAVDDFNMGAMENKGLNIFNSKYVLASPETATDVDYDFIEGIIAHEYFHNWTGNRITCRDWFQLCLKEGLTVFRDQQFSADMRSAPVKRIEDVLQLRARQFREDAGPLAHPVRPEEYIEINNFYTATVYEKGAEVIRMLKALVGDDAYDAALRLYFDRHDGQACTIEDWLQVFEDVTGRDLSQFKRWYGQAGTPVVTVDTALDGGIYRMTFRQTVPPTPGEPLKEPAVIPIRFGLLHPEGPELVPSILMELTDPEQEIEIDLARACETAGLPLAEPVPSLLRGFSAPVILRTEQDRAARLTLMAHDTDPFNRWEAGRSLAKEALTAMVTDNAPADPDWLGALGELVGDQGLDPDFRALALALPSEDDMAETLARGGITPDPTAIHDAMAKAETAIAETHVGLLTGLFDQMAVPGPYSPDAASAGRRSLRLAALRYLSRIDGGDRAAALFEARPNMTEEMAAFTSLLRIGRRDAAATFEARWRHDSLVMDKWFMAQVATAEPAEAVATAKRLTEHADFDWKNPNRFRSVMGGLTAGNPAGFHWPDGSGYRFLADWILTLDPKNPQTASRMSTAFETRSRYDADRKGLIDAELARVAATDGLSRDVAEMVARMRSA